MRLRQLRLPALLFGVLMLDATLDAPVLPQSHTRFRFPWTWDGSEAILTSRATDETGYVQPTREQLVAVRGRECAPEGADPLRREGRVGCGREATVGPDLTHIASRSLLAAGEIPNTPENMARWIDNPQKIKPGTRMPANKFSSNDLNALVEYLESLK